jgi:hypothetical protein
MKKITLEIPKSLDEKEVLEWVRIKVDRHIRAIKEKEVPTVDALVKPIMDDFDAKNKLVADVKPIEEKPIEEKIDIEKPL